MLSKKEQIIYALSDQECDDDEIYDAIWQSCKELRHLLSRRKWPGEILKAIEMYEGRILHLDGTLFVLSENDKKLFGSADFRWLDCYLAVGPNGKRLYHRAREFERIRILDLYFQINFPMSIGSSYR